ncbi:MAG: cytochrome-c oxidase, cbb3-type subunit III [Alphaproteobacteria bacterium]|nr:MAG: cytochrome-c oxidase, cbb3-type subunit III [Alphaproteobacteria bacterium]
MANKRIDQPTGTETVGHEWDGIEELNTPLPRWWLWLFYITIVWAAVYTVLYPAWPMISKGTEGYFGWTSRGQLAQEIDAVEASRAEFRTQLANLPVEQLQANPGLMGQAVAGGSAAFKVNCVQCHGSGAAGSPGFPNLADDDWLWGGDIKAIETTLTHGIRQPGDGATRLSAMPPFAGAFSPAQMNALVDHVLSLSGNGQSSAVGAQLYADNCVACHGAAGEGDRMQGAPRLNDAITLYGNSRDAIARQIQQPRMGVMPSWQGRLDPVTIKMLAAYVHSLGGGEDFVEAGPEPVTQADEQP